MIENGDHKALDTLALTVPPKITEHIQSAKAHLDELLSIIPDTPKTDDGLRLVKRIRADLRKEFDQMETQRKEIKKALLAPYDAAMEKYAAGIEKPYRAADRILADWVDSYESDIKHACELRLRAYHRELCDVYGLDFVPYEACAPKITMDLARKKEPDAAMESIHAFLQQVSFNLDTTMCLPDSEAVYAEYRQSLNLPQAIHTVQARRAAQAEAQNQLSARAESAQEKAQEAAQLLSAAPELQEQEEIFSLSFRARGNLQSLRAMKAFALSQGITLEEIKENDYDQ